MLAEPWLPSESVAVTTTPWLPLLRPDSVFGDVHAPAAAPSTAQVTLARVTTGSTAVVNPTLAPVALVSALGFVVMFTLGAVDAARTTACVVAGRLLPYAFCAVTVKV